MDWMECKIGSPHLSFSLPSMVAHARILSLRGLLTDEPLTLVLTGELPRSLLQI